MTDVTTAPSGTQAKVTASLRRRYAAEMRFRAYGIVAIAIGLAGMLNARVAVGIADHASIGWLESLIEPSIRIFPGVGQ